MSRAIVWNTTGKILETFDEVSEAEEWIEECDHHELYRDTKGGDTNIMVAESF